MSILRHLAKSYSTYLNRTISKDTERIILSSTENFCLNYVKAIFLYHVSYVNIDHSSKEISQFYHSYPSRFHRLMKVVRLWWESCRIGMRLQNCTSEASHQHRSLHNRTCCPENLYSHNCRGEKGRGAIGRVYMPSQLERTPQFCSWGR